MQKTQSKYMARNGMRFAHITTSVYTQSSRHINILLITTDVPIDVFRFERLTLFCSLGPLRGQIGKLTNNLT